MKKIIVLLIASLFAGGILAQIPEIGNKKKCYERYDKDGKKLTQEQRRYAEWQCGKLAGVLDCHENLEYDEQADIVLRRNNDMVNSSGSGKPYSGQCETCHMNGILERRITFVNGKENGIDTSYYKSGCPQVVRNNIQGVRAGQWLYYYDSTEYLAWEMNFQLGEKHGKHIFFKASGDTTRWENYNNGLLHGVKRMYYSKSRIKTEVTYENGNLNGSFKTFNLKGVIIQDLTYKNGKKDGQAKHYYDDGTLLKTEQWSMGVKDGEFKVFFYEGHIQVSETFKKGMPIGWATEYYPDSKVKRKILYDKKGQRIEEHRYDEQGRETYAYGTPDDSGAEDDEMPSTGKKKKR